MVAVASRLGWDRPAVPWSKPERAVGLPRRRIVPPEAGAALRAAAVGFGGLVALPVLLIASLVLEAPFAAPAAIALGYLPAARAALRGEMRQAGRWSLAVLAGLLCWTIVFLANGDGWSTAELGAALLVPLFALAPIVVGIVGRRRAGAVAEARADAACLEALAPGEAVLFVDPCGALLTGTRAGFAALGLASEGIANLADGVVIADRLRLLDAVAAAVAQHRPIDLIVTASRENAEHPVAPSLSLSLSPGRGGAIAVRVRETAPSVVPHASAVPVAPMQSPALAVAGATPRCSVREAVGFAMRRVAPEAKKRGVTLIFRGAGDAGAACDTTLCRRIVVLGLETGAAAGAPGAAIDIGVRRLKGVVLVRLACPLDEGAAAPAAAEFEARIRRTGLRELVDQAGGSLLVERPDGAVGLAIRLPSADAAPSDHTAISCEVA